MAMNRIFVIERKKERKKDSLFLNNSSSSRIDTYLVYDATIYEFLVEQEYKLGMGWSWEGPLG